MKRWAFWIRLLVSLLAAGALTAVAGMGWLYIPDQTVSDLLYQQPSVTDGDVVVVGIDQRALDVLGPMPWNRSVYAEAIEFLNADPENRPAGIGVDVLFIGDSADPDADAYLAEAAAIGDNVVFASAATYGADLVVTDDGDFYMDTRSIRGWEQPYDALLDAARIGHINTMADEDSLIRHVMLYEDVPGVGRVYSMAWELYQLWCDYHGTTPHSPPATLRNFFYLPFTGTPGAYYESVSVVDLLDGTVTQEEFAGKVVFIGPYAMGMQDEYRTSIAHAAPMYGVEIMANMVDAFRTGFFPRNAADFWQLDLVFLLSAAALLFFWDRRILVALPVWLATVAGWLGLCRLLYEHAGIILHVLWVPLFISVLFVVTVAINYFRAQRERRRVTNTFGRYVDPAIIHELLVTGGDHLELGGKMFDIAVLFVDIRGFTSMSESLDPPTVVEIINMYLTLTTECIMRYHGTLDKFVGDCTMAFWNAPLPQEDPVYLACRAAVDMAEGAKPLGEELQRRFGRSVSFGIGVHVGPAVVGNIGAPMRMDYTAIGDTVNTASRLESNAPSGTIYISRAVADALGNRAQVTSLGDSVKLKGKAEGFEVLRLDHLDT